LVAALRSHGVQYLLTGGQACVLYGAAEFSRDLDLAVLATPEALTSLTAALHGLSATVIDVPPFCPEYLAGGHVVHFSVPAIPVEGSASPLRVDVMSVMRGVDAFPALWSRRATLALRETLTGDEVLVDVMALPDLVNAKKTQRDKDWPMIRRLVDASYANGLDTDASTEQVAFWLAELRIPEFLHDVVHRFPDASEASSRVAVQVARRGGDVEPALEAERQHEVALDRAWWAPLRRELEALRHASRRE
jgi:hypothetical protein